MWLAGNKGARRGERIRVRCATWGHRAASGAVSCESNRRVSETGRGEKASLFFQHLIKDHSIREMLFLGVLPAAESLIDGDELQLRE